MKVKDVLDSLDTAADDVRGENVVRLMVVLCPLSVKSMQNFQIDWDKSKPWSDFKKEQTALLRECVALETSQMGAHVRKVCSLDELTMDTEI